MYYSQAACHVFSRTAKLSAFAEGDPYR